MMNKRPLVNFCLLLLLIGLGGFFFAPMARAETSAACQSFVADTTPVSEAGGTTAAGITPANTVYFLDKFGDWIKLRLFSFTQDSKINTLLDQAQERVGELEDLAEQNNLKVAYVNSIISSYNGIMAEVDERLAGLVSNGNDVEDILERIVKISAKNQLVVATLLTNVAADNYNKIYSAYNNTSDNFCTSVGAWVNRVNQCSDAVVMYQELNNNYANIVATINEAANNFADLSAGYQAASIYQEKLVALQDYLETYINGLIYYLGDSDGSVADKTYHLQNFLNSITTDSNYVQVLASQPGLIVDDTGADSSAADRGLIASLSFLQKLTAGLGGYDSPLSFALAFKTNEVNGLTGEIKQLDSLIANRRSRIAYLKDSQETCAGLEKSYRKVITNLRTNKLSKAKDLIDDIWSSLNTLDESYLTGCGLSETIKFLHNVSQNGDLFSDSNCTNSSYASELATWASQQSMVWEMMDSFHDQLINVYQAEINTYQAIRTVRASLLSAANNDLALMNDVDPDDYSDLSLLDREDDFGYERDLASVELDALSSQIKPMITQIKTATTNVNTTKAAVQTATDNLAACIDETSAHVSTYCASFEEALATAQDNYQTAVAVLEELGANYQILTEKVYNIAVSEIEFSIIRQELGDFMDQRFNRVVGDYQDILVALGNNWSEFGAANNRYQNEILANLSFLRTALDNHDVTASSELVAALRGKLLLTAGSQINQADYKLDQNFSVLNWLGEVNVWGSERVSNVYESIRGFLVEMKGLVCGEAQSLYTGGVTAVCDLIGIGDFTNSCAVMTNFQKQVINDCRSEAVHNCGNGSLDSGEQCDDGNNLSGDGCSALCQSEISTYCGDGKIQSPNSYGIYEECENMPPNALAGDGCSARCLNEVAPACGDGILQYSDNVNPDVEFTSAHVDSTVSGYYEQCDDGNILSGDGCNALCQVEMSELKKVNIRQTKP